MLLMEKVLKSPRKTAFKFLPSILTAFLFLLNIVFSSFSAFAGAVAVPVSAELIGALLVALGLMTGNATDGFTWVSNDNPYVDSIFESQVSTITSGVPISSQTLESLKGSVIPDDTYTTDGSNFFISGKKVTSSDFYVTASSLANVSYSMPTNITGASAPLGILQRSGYRYCVVPFPSAFVGTDAYFVPYYETENSSFISTNSVNFVSYSVNNTISSLVYNFSNNTFFNSSEKLGSNVNQSSGVLVFPFLDGSNSDFSRYYWRAMNRPFSDTAIGAPAVSFGYYPAFRRVSGSGDYSPSSVVSATLLHTVGRPSFAVSGDKEKLSGAIVKVENSEDDDNDPNTPPTPIPPQKWDLWKSLKDLMVYIDTGDISNGGTDFGQYVNNNYNYVQVDVNIPDEINNNVNIGGSLGINGSGDINITLHEDISLPSAGDGSGFYNPSAVEVVGALAKDNPIISVISSLFSAIDPALVGIFSISVSLLLVLGLWKLIRG